MIGNVIAEFEKCVRKLNSKRHAGNFRKLHVTVLGQQGLLIRRESLSMLHLLATTDFDGLLNGEPPLEDLFKMILKNEGLTYDEQSTYIWLPEETKYETIYRSEIIEVISPLPVYLIVSKAVKAPEKNKQLILEAIEQFGDDLLKMFEKYEVNIDYFFGDANE